MIFYDANFNTDGNPFPSTGAINVSTPGAGDGTEFLALMVNDEWGARQGIMSYAQLTPDGSSEFYSTSQFVKALKYALSPVGTVLASHVQGNPFVLGFRVLELTGQGVLRSNYPELDTLCYVGDGNNDTAHYYYRADDITGLIRNIAGVYLILPDMRGTFIRGWDPTAIIDPDGVSRIFPSLQEFAFQEHHHNNKTDTGFLVAQQVITVDTGTTHLAWKAVADPGAVSNKLFAQEAIEPAAHGSTAGIKISTETRPTNIQVKWWVRF
jgi:hypothetical protein